MGGGEWILGGGRGWGMVEYVMGRIVVWFFYLWYIVILGIVCEIVEGFKRKILVYEC